MSEEENKKITNAWGSAMGIMPDIPPRDRYKDALEDDDHDRTGPNLTILTVVVGTIVGLAIFFMAIAGALVYGLQRLGMSINAFMNW